MTIPAPTILFNCMMMQVQEAGVSKKCRPRARRRRTKASFCERWTVEEEGRNGHGHVYHCDPGTPHQHRAIRTSSKDDRRSSYLSVIGREAPRRCRRASIGSNRQHSRPPDPLHCELPQVRTAHTFDEPSLAPLTENPIEAYRYSTVWLPDSLQLLLSLSLPQAVRLTHTQSSFLHNHPNLKVHEKVR